MDVNKVIDNLATKFSTTVPCLISEMQKYYIISAATHVALCLVLTIISLIIAKNLTDKGMAIKKADKWDDWEQPFAFGCASYAVSLGFGIGFIIAIKDLLQWYITPTASVLAEVLTMISR